VKRQQERFQVKDSQGVERNDSIVLEMMELAEADVPFCPCGARTIPVARNDALWLECASLAEDKPFLTRLITLEFLFGHTRRLITEMEESA
jgi:hypothetical protein